MTVEIDVNGVVVTVTLHWELDYKGNYWVVDGGVDENGAEVYLGEVDRDFAIACAISRQMDREA